MEAAWPPEGLAKPAQRPLAGAGVGDLATLAGLRRAEVARLHGMGPGGLTVLERALAAAGLAFRP